MNFFNTKNSNENLILDFDQEDNSHKYEQFYLRGLTLSSEQNYYYKKCKEIDYLFFDKEESNNDFNNNKELHKKANGLKCTNLKLKPRMFNNYGKNIFIEKRKKIPVKYCLKDLLTTGNPIKIKI